MKLVFFDDYKLGVLDGQRVVDVSREVEDIPRVTAQDLLMGLIENFDSLKPSLEAAVRRSNGVPRNEVKLLPPVPRPTTIVAMAANYLELGAMKEPPPINAFLKSPNTIIGDRDTVVLPEAKAAVFHHEAELGVVVGKEASRVKAEDAYEHVFGYVNFIDVSARGLGGGSFFWCKSWDTFGPIGPCLVTADEVPDPQKLTVRLWVNGVLRQEYSTSDMAHNIRRSIEWASAITPLEPGDLIATGTNHQGLGPLQDGDLVEMETDHLERLAVRVHDSLKREWPREVDHATADRAAGRAKSGGFGEPAPGR